MVITVIYLISAWFLDSELSTCLSLLASYIGLYTFVKLRYTGAINTQILYSFVSCSVILKVIIFVYSNVTCRVTIVGYCNYGTNHPQVKRSTCITRM